MNLSRTLLLLALLFTASGTLMAQGGDQRAANVRTVLETEDEATRLSEEKKIGKKTAGNTPLELVLSLRDAMRAGDWERAGGLLDTRYLPEAIDAIDPAVLAEHLAHAWAQQNIVDLSTLSDEPDGHLDDGLPDYREQIGTIRLPESDIPVYLQRIPGPQETRVWRVSNATVVRIPAMWDALGYHPLAVRLGDFLPPFRAFGMENWQLVGVIIAFLLAWPVAALAGGLLSLLARRVLRGEPGAIIGRFFRVPVRFFLFLFLARALIDQLGLSVTARVYIESSGVDFLAAGVLILGTITLARDFQILRLERAGRAQYRPLMRPFSLILKILVVIILGLVWAHDAGYNMSTVLAGLGVGSLAVALAAQKTLENVIGAFMLYTARPVSPGDFCRFGSAVGTVEEIGLRSTVIRTLDRSLVVIPNAMFSALEIENISRRDAIRFYRHLHVFAGSTDQFRVLLTEIRRLFLAHPRVAQESVSVRLERIEGATGVIRIDSRVATSDYQDFLAVAEDLNLRLMDAVADAGLSLTAPGQYLEVGARAEAPGDARERAEALLGEWRREDRWPFPDFGAEDRERLRGSLEYPARGSDS